MGRRMWVGIAGWLTTGMVATAAGVGALTIVGSDLTGPSTPALSEEEVRQALAATSPSIAPSAGSPGSSRPPAATGVTKVLTSPGGSVLARCADGRVSLDWWTPQQGYQVDDVDRGPGREARVEFESADGEVELRITCQGGSPMLSVHD